MDRTSNLKTLIPGNKKKTVTFYIPLIRLSKTFIETKQKRPLLDRKGSYGILIIIKRLPCGRRTARFVYMYQTCVKKKTHPPLTSLKVPGIIIFSVIFVIAPRCNDMYVVFLTCKYGGNDGSSTFNVQPRPLIYK